MFSGFVFRCITYYHRNVTATRFGLRFSRQVIILCNSAIIAAWKAGKRYRRYKKNRAKEHAVTAVLIELSCGNLYTINRKESLLRRGRRRTGDFKMEAVTLDTRILPSPIRERIHTPKVSVTERDGTIILLPVSEGSGLRGIAAQSKLTTKKMREYKQADKTLEL
jgi:hypothetical protein